MFNNLSARLTSIVKSIRGQGRLTEENIKKSLEEVRGSLLDADVPLAVIEEFLANVQKKALGQEVLASLRPGDELIKVVNEELVATLGEENEVGLNLKSSPPVVVMIVGLQGCGKTTSSAKLAKWLKEKQKRSVVLVSADIYRPAAIKQLEILARDVEVDYMPSTADEDPVEIATRAVDYAKSKIVDCVIVDTAGRLHIDDEMMEELKKLHHAVNPAETLLTVDSMTGQDAVNTAKIFSEAINLTGVILTKTDGDARGGAALAMRTITKKPIKFMGTGEKMDALELFYPDRVASRILGMGDILTLVEDAYHKADHENAKKLAKKFKKGKAFDLEDFRTQLQQMQKMGGLKSLLSKLPGMGNVEQLQGQIDEKVFVKMAAIINSMTPKERHFPAFIKASHKKRIATGSGTSVQDVNKLLKQFGQTQKMMQRLKSSKVQKMLASFPGF